MCPNSAKFRLGPSLCFSQWQQRTARARSCKSQHSVIWAQFGHSLRDLRMTALGRSLNFAQSAFCPLLKLGYRAASVKMGSSQASIAAQRVHNRRSWKKQLTAHSRHSCFSLNAAVRPAKTNARLHRACGRRLLSVSQWLARTQNALTKSETGFCFKDMQDRVLSIKQLLDRTRFVF